jgi:predicted Zn-dependent protease
MDLEGWTAARAEECAALVAWEEQPVWEEAARWLKEVERRAEEAEAEAEMAIRTATVGTWIEAAEHARRACQLEFSTGRTFRRRPPTWQRLSEVVTLAAWDHDRRRAAANRITITILHDS